MIPEEQKQKLIKAAKDALNNPYKKPDGDIYTAAVLTQKGNIYAGVSYFSDTYSLTLHGEQAALSHAASHREMEIVAIAIASTQEKSAGEFTNPCHMCKQVLYESSRRSGLEMLIILTNNHDETHEVSLSDMLPYPWPV